jgi:ABC-type polysaccharide/polyol phosphate transport system ATPase subunit/SAM-dependent methyltransferase
MSLLIESEISAAGADLREGAKVVVRLTDVSVEYRAPRERIRSFKEYAIRSLQGRIEHEEFKALREVSLEIREGEVFGIIGHNGAGKSTLLKVVSRVMRPTRGRVWVKGRIAPLLELGAGFHPELSGRENVFLNGTLLGYTRAEMGSLFDGIVDFAELWDFIDAPLRTYSTGMAVRLGFAVATATRPDILIVDEVLAVGDEQFQEKCTARMNGFRTSGTTILLVTHDSGLVLKICDRAAWIDHGQVRAVGDPQTIVDQYHKAYNPPAYSSERESAQEPRSETSFAVIPPSKAQTLEEKILRKSWFYRFDLPGGGQTPCYLPAEVARYHDDRLAMLYSAIDPIYERDWSSVSCLDIGCNQGFFAVKMAERGCRQVLGIDVRAENIEDAKMIGQLYDLPDLSYDVADLYDLKPDETGQFDVVLMLSLLFLLENPINAIRIARALTRNVLIVETAVAPEVSGQIDWGNHKHQKQLHGSFSLIDQSDERHVPLCSLSGISLCPGRESLIWLMKKLGFSRVEVIPPPAGAFEQLASGKRIMVAGFIEPGRAIEQKGK